MRSRASETGKQKRYFKNDKMNPWIIQKRQKVFGLAVPEQDCIENMLVSDFLICTKKSPRKSCHETLRMF